MICPEPALGHGQIIAVSLHDRIVGSHGHLSVNFHPLQHGLDRTLAILIDVAVGSDARFKHSLDLVRLLFNLLYVHDQSARGIAEKFTGSRQDDKAELLSQKIYRRRANVAEVNPCFKAVSRDSTPPVARNFTSLSGSKP